MNKDKELKDTLKIILMFLYVDELKDIINRWDIPSAGNKEQIIKNIVNLGPSPKEIIGSLKADGLRTICDTLSIKTGKKEDMISAILQFIKEEAAAAEVPIKFLDATIDNVTSKLKELTITEEIRKEVDLEDEMYLHLSDFFRDVVHQYFLGGYLGLKIDLDIDNGKVGVETKLADSLLKNSSEIFRMIGQGVYYQKKRYGDNLVIAVAGKEEDLEDPVIREAFSFLSNINIRWLTIPIE